MCKEILKRDRALDILAHSRSQAGVRPRTGHCDNFMLRLRGAAGTARRMLDFLRRREGPSPVLTQLQESLRAVQEKLDEPSPIEAQVQELTELVQKSTRAQSRLGLRLEELERKIEGGFTELRTRAPAPSRADLRWDDLLDALDLLDEAAAAVADQSVRTGLGAIGERLVRQLTLGGITRLGRAEGPVDGRRFRVVGTEDCEGVPPRSVVRVVRAAALRGSELIREGEVVVARSTT